jgi:hypothetical protein
MDDLSDLGQPRGAIDEQDRYPNRSPIETAVRDRTRCPRGAGLSSIKPNGPSRPFYDRKRAEGKIHTRH